MKPRSWCLLSLGNRLGTVNPGLSPDWFGPLSGRTAGGLRLGGRLGLCNGVLAEAGQGGGQGRVAVLGGVDGIQAPQLHWVVYIHIWPSQAENPAQSGRESGPVRLRYPAQSG